MSLEGNAAGLGIPYVKKECMKNLYELHMTLREANKSKYSEVKPQLVRDKRWFCQGDRTVCKQKLRSHRASRRQVVSRSLAPPTGQSQGGTRLARGQAVPDTWMIPAAGSPGSSGSGLSLTCSYWWTGLSALSPVSWTPRRVADGLLRRPSIVLVQSLGLGPCEAFQRR